jgi:glycosyltransferase involved in cell wall biosynthesis
MKNNIKVLHVVSGNLTEGAARGAYWLHKGLISNGVESKILCNSRYIDQYDSVTSTVKSDKDRIIKKINSLIDGIPKKFYYKSEKRIFSSGIGGINLTKHHLFEWANVINLHWINDGFINIKHLNKIKKPIVWTMRDMWPMTGGCHYSLECDRYKTGCGKCIQLASDKDEDLSSYIYRRKEKYLPKNIKLVGISNWLSQEAKNSMLFKNYDIKTIYNSVNSSQFTFKNKEISRNNIGIMTSKNIILCGSKGLKDFYKGFSKFVEALSGLDKKKYFLCFFGNIDDSLIKNFGYEFKNFGYVQDDILLNNIYSAADVFIAPSIMEAFGKTIAESMACGTPVVCFDATGPKDIVTHKVDGYRAKPFDDKDLADGIDWICSNKNYNDLCLNARKKIVNNFDSTLIAKQYVDLYNDVLREA